MSPAQPKDTDTALADDSSIQQQAAASEVSVNRQGRKLPQPIIVEFLTVPYPVLSFGGAPQPHESDALLCFSELSLRVKYVS